MRSVVSGFRHVRTTRDQLILRWDPPDSPEDTDPSIVTVPAHDSISIGSLRDIAENAGAKNFETCCEWIDEHHRNRLGRR